MKVSLPLYFYLCIYVYLCFLLFLVQIRKTEKLKSMRSNQTYPFTTGLMIFIFLLFQEKDGNKHYNLPLLIKVCVHLSQKATFGIFVMNWICDAYVISFHNLNPKIKKQFNFTNFNPKKKSLILLLHWKFREGLAHWTHLKWRKKFWLNFISVSSNATNKGQTHSSSQADAQL